jgi:hypothetical protein
MRARSAPDLGGPGLPAAAAGRPREAFATR